MGFASRPAAHYYFVSGLRLMTFTATQTALTFIFNIVATIGFIYITLSFIMGAIRATPRQTNAHFKRIGKGLSVSQAVESLGNDNVVPFQRPQVNKENDQSVIELAEMDTARIAAVESLDLHQTLQQHAPNFALLGLPQLKEWAQRNQVDREWVRQFGKLTLRNTWEEALNTFVASA